MSRSVRVGEKEGGREKIKEREEAGKNRESERKK